jgi:hypothetical protein
MEKRKTELEAKLASEANPQKRAALQIQLLETEKALAKIRQVEKARRTSAKKRREKKEEASWF